MIGLVKKKKKKSNQATRKKIKWAVDEKRRKAKRAENRAWSGGTKGQTSNFLTPSFTCSEENIDFLYELHKENLLGTCLKL